MAEHKPDKDWAPGAALIGALLVCVGIVLQWEAWGVALIVAGLLLLIITYLVVLRR